MTYQSNKVARIGKRYWRHAGYSHNSNWRMQLRILAKWMLICIAVLFITTLVLAFMPRTSAISEFRPGVTPDIKHNFQSFRINNV